MNFNTWTTQNYSFIVAHNLMNAYNLPFKTYHSNSYDEESYYQGCTNHYHQG